MRVARKKKNPKKSLDDLQNAALFLGVALISFFLAVIFNCQPNNFFSKRNSTVNDQKKQVIFQSSLIKEVDFNQRVYKIADILKNQQEFLGREIYLEGYLISKYYCKNEKEKCDEKIEDFLIISDFNKRLNNYLINSPEDINRLIVRAKTVRMPEKLLDSLKIGEKIVVKGELIDNYVPIGETSDGKTIDGLMLVYEKLALAK